MGTSGGYVDDRRIYLLESRVRREKERMMKNASARKATPTFRNLQYKNQYSSNYVIEESEMYT